jgi:hypothetical protein
LLIPFGLPRVAYWLALPVTFTVISRRRRAREAWALLRRREPTRRRPRGWRIGAAREVQALGGAGSHPTLLLGAVAIATRRA